MELFSIRIQRTFQLVSTNYKTVFYLLYLYSFDIFIRDKTL